MANPIPSLLALTSIADGSAQQASPLRNNYSAIQTAANALITALSGGLAKQVLTASDATDVAYAYPPGYEYAYNEFTAPVAINTTTEATANTVVTASAVTFDGVTVVRVEFEAPYVQLAAAAGALVNFVLYDGAVSIGLLANYGNQVASTMTTTVGLIGRRLTPSAGAHTYSVRAYEGGGAGSVGAGAGGAGFQMPGFIRITKV